MIDIGPSTVTEAVTGAIFVPLAVIVVVPAPTAVIGMLMAGTLLPSQKKKTRGGAVATLGLLEVRVIAMPSFGLKSGPPGTCESSLSSIDPCCPGASVTLVLTHCTVAPI